VVVFEYPEPICIAAQLDVNAQSAENNRTKGVIAVGWCKHNGSLDEVPGVAAYGLEFEQLVCPAGVAATI